MYEELIADLRKWYCDIHTLRKAADAIEDMNMKLEQYKQKEETDHKIIEKQRQQINVLAYLQPRNIKEKKKRKYYRKCGACGERHEQSEMYRDRGSPNGWLCQICHQEKHTEYYIEEF